MVKHILLAAICFALGALPVHADKCGADFEKAEHIVKSFLAQDDNVDSEENVWIVVKAVADIEPVDSRKKLEFL